MGPLSATAPSLGMDPSLHRRAAERDPALYEAMSLTELSSVSVTGVHVTDAVFAVPVWVLTVMSPRNNAPSARSPRTRISFHVLLSTTN